MLWSHLRCDCRARNVLVWTPGAIQGLREGEQDQGLQQGELLYVSVMVNIQLVDGCEAKP